MTIRKLWVCAVMFAVSMGYACSDPTSAPTHRPQMSVNGAGRLQVYNAGVDRAVPATPCLDDARHHQFDFWLGTWDMNGQRSMVRSLLDGCIVEENYMPLIPPAAPGLPPGPLAIQGRSINAYDRDTGRWHQTWVSIFPTGHLRMNGNLIGGKMMLGLRFGTFFIDFQWEIVGQDSVLQSWNFNGRQNSLLYVRTPAFELADPAPSDLCQLNPSRPGGEHNRELDFLLGSWTVTAEYGIVLGTSTVASDLSGCLARENYTTDKGYAAHSYLYYDVNTARFHRTYIDSEAERMEMSGVFVNGALVLRGAEFGPDGMVYQVRNTIKPIDANTLLQTWETSLDAVDWKTDMALTFTRISR